ncbi:MAG TPA: recombinase family protein [Acidimicrobiales bacterium]|nr:recombinase family protein [Acidimicrobiales bacterium]
MTTLAPLTERYVAIYVRISVDKSGRGEGVERQEEWGRAYAAEHWPGVAVRVFPDNNLTAFDENVQRPGYDDLRAAILAGEVGHIWTVEMTRLEANRRRWVDLTIDLDDVGITEVHTNREGIVTLDEVADVKNVFAYRERKRLRERLKDTMQDLADKGRPRSGAVYGYDHGVDEDGRKTLVVNRVEAEVVRWMATALLSGWARAQIARRLNQFNAMRLAFGLPACLPKRAGRPRLKNDVIIGYVSLLWVPQKVTAVVTKPGVAGRRVHMGEDHTDGTWEPILDEVTWRRVCALLEKPRKVVGNDGKPYITGKPRVPSRGYPLTGYLYCAACKWRLNGKGRQNPSGWQRRYACIAVSDTTPTGCGHTTIVAQALEDHVYDELLTYLQSPEFLAGAASADGVAERREELAAAITDLDDSRVQRARQWGAGELNDDEWDAARAGLDHRKSTLTAELAALPTPRADIDPTAIVADWALMDDNERRHVIGNHITRIVIGRPTPGIQRFDPGRVVIEWR